jgi:hypothetical protein
MGLTPLALRERPYEGSICGRGIPIDGERSGGAPFVPMMEPTDFGDRHDLPGSWRLDGARFWRILLQAEVCTAPMIVVREVSEMAI